MKIAWFTHRYFPYRGGAENYGREIVRRFVALGHEADVLTSDAYDLWYFNDPKRRRVEGPPVEWVDGARVRRFPVRHIPAQRYVGRLLSYLPHWPTKCQVASYMPILPGLGKVRGPYDLVFAVGFPYTLFAYSALRTARAAGVPLVLMPFLHLATPGDRVHKSYTQPHQIRLLREADLVVTMTGLETEAVTGWGIPRSRLLTLGAGVNHANVTGGDAEGFRRRLAIPPASKVVGQLGANDPNKGTTHLVEAVAALNEGRPERDRIYLVLAGARSPAFESFLAKLPDSARAWLRVLGVISEEEIPSFYAAIDLFAMPSRTDSFGIVFLEAWANGLPVVAAAAGGVAEVVEHGRTGLLVPFGDVAALGEALGELLGDPERARRFGEEGREHVSRGFTWDDRFDVLLSRTRELTPRRPGGRASAARPPRRSAGKSISRAS